MNLDARNSQRIAVEDGPAAAQAFVAARFIAQEGHVGKTESRTSTRSATARTKQAGSVLCLYAILPVDAPLFGVSSPRTRSDGLWR
jgi:hypothetical protein